MEKKLSAMTLVVSILLFSCQAVYTTSLFEWAQRDPSNMSTEGKIAYAEDALAAGDRDAMEEAYDALKDTSDPALFPFVAELALGAAGVTAALADMLGDIAAGGTEAEIEAALEAAVASFGAADLALIGEAAVLVQGAETASAAITADQYFIAGVGLLVVALDAAGGTASAIDTTTPGGPGETAVAFLTSALSLFAPGSEAETLLNDFILYF